MVKISEELEAIDNLLMEFHDRIRSGRCLVNRTQSAFMFDYLHRLANKDEAISFSEACKYTRLPSSTFRRYVKDGKLPAGKKRLGFTEKVWYPKELDEYLDRLVNRL